MAYATDVFARQQAYLEWVKNDEQDRFDELETALVGMLLALLTKTKYATLGDMPKRELRTLLAQVNSKAKAIFDKFRPLTIKRLKDILDADAYVTRTILSRVQPKPLPAMPSRKLLWSKVTNDIIAGAGLAPLDVMTTFFNGVLNELLQLIRRGYAENWTMKDAQAALVGTQKNGFKDGSLRKLRNSYGSMTDTLIQHISSVMSVFFGSIIADTYEWISVLDSRTTEICLSRNGNVYHYGQGPIPPAHYRCRSRIRAVWEAGRVPVQPTFYSWIVDQPTVVQNDLLGDRIARQLRSGELQSDNFPRYTTARRLTAQGYRDRVDTMLTPIEEAN